ncbi:uncharacterized protein LOC5571114 [Aedes aegypti]|uniref:Uncharacterized protein n=1 Tax=Aedes aegypti TaxID=7159 RepID=A0A6I8T4G1_AEDAE|nr:uncharacterized protein LOC5571114 [Aedes aegypti]
MSAGFRSPSELLKTREHNGNVEEEEEKSTFFRRSASEKQFSVRKLVHQFENRASHRFERISERFSSKRKKFAHAKKDADSSGAISTNTAAAEAEKPSSTALWYLPNDKITEDNEEWESADDGEKREDDYEEDLIPDASDICDCWNEFIYLQLSKENAEFLNSYDSDFEEDCDETSAEASNTIISLKWPGDVVHYIVHGYYQPTDQGNQQLEQDVDDDDEFSESDGSSFSDEEILVEPEEKDSKLSYLINELIETESNYINALERGIAAYIHNVFETDPTPIELKNMKYHLFGNIEFIHKFHKTIFLPKLMACGKDVQKLAKVFCQYLENDSFYGYVLYALYNTKSQRLCEQLAKFFESQQNCSGDKLGVKSFILQPIQRLPRYKILLENIAKALRSSESVSGDESSTQLNAVLGAKQMMESFITIMNESMAVVEIMECKEPDDDEVELGFGVPKPATILREQNNKTQYIFLYPRDSENMKKVKPINLLHQGKFKKSFPVFFNDLRLDRQYKGKLFMFERCIFYTEELKTKQLSYRGHFSHQEVSYDFSNLQILRIISKKDAHHSIEVKINIQIPETNLAVIVELLRSIILKRERKESFVMESKELTMIGHSVTKRFPSIRSSFSSNASGSSCWSTLEDNQFEDSTSIDCSAQMMNSGNETSFNQIVNFIQYYEKALEDNIKFYIYSQSNDVRSRLIDLTEVLGEMLKTQQDINYRLVEENLYRNSELSLTHFCDTFHDSIKRSEFDVFLRYVQHFKAAENVLMTYENYCTGLPKPENMIFLSVDAFLHLPVEYVNRCCTFFEAVYNDTHSTVEEITLRNTLLDYKISYVRNQLLLLRQRVNENYYIRQHIMDVNFLQEIELVQYSEIIKLDGSYANYRLFLMKTGLLCMKIKQDMPETYSSVTLYYPYTKTTARNSHRSGKRWTAYLDGRRTTLIFEDKQKRHAFNERYSTLAEQMRQREGVTKKSFFSLFETS